MSDEMMDTNSVELATELTIAWLSNPNTRASGEDVPAFLQQMHAAVTQLSQTGQSAGAADTTTEYTPRYRCANRLPRRITSSR